MPLSQRWAGEGCGWMRSEWSTAWLPVFKNDWLSWHQLRGATPFYFSPSLCKAIFQIRSAVEEDTGETRQDTLQIKVYQTTAKETDDFPSNLGWEWCCKGGKMCFQRCRVILKCNTVVKTCAYEHIFIIQNPFFFTQCSKSLFIKLGENMLFKPKSEKCEDPPDLKPLVNKNHYLFWVALFRVRRLTNWTSEPPKPGEQAVLHTGTWCREPECNERDILMAFHLFMHGKWRGAGTLWNSWQNKEPTLGKWLYLWFRADRWRYQEGGKSDDFLTVQSVKWCDVWQHTRALTLRMSASGVKTWEVICSCLSAMLLLVPDMHMMDQDINPCSRLQIYIYIFIYFFFLKALHVF